eukprot:CAMPEP_0171008996 /NCGR_PEP_ID=MMETSP0736-20130129/21002_1 /TAXON_ID=186038 /ORGANISM="Fragilariopsis kerguelensis, Strain L26-C5" /LENGTH=315 /DNA_ID=CAMNT_0011440413 /DNA_START=147 /DNA_END=1091 /DNA_ORIENTATION=-
MAIVTVFRFEDVSRATISAFGSSTSSSSPSRMRMVPVVVVDALNVQVDHHRSSSQPQLRQQPQRQQQRPRDLSLSMRTVAEGGLFQVSQGTDIFNNNNNDVAVATATATSTLSTVDEQKLVEDLQQQHAQMKKMMQRMRPQQQETQVNIPSVITTKAIIGKTSVSSCTGRSSTTRTTATTSGRMATILKGIRLSSANDRHPMPPPPKKKKITSTTRSSISKEGMLLPRLSSAMVNNGELKLGPISYKMVVQDLRTQDVQRQQERDERMTILGIYLASLSSPFDDEEQEQEQEHNSAMVGPISPCWKQKQHLVVSI